MSLRMRTSEYTHQTIRQREDDKFEVITYDHLGQRLRVDDSDEVVYIDISATLGVRIRRY